MCRFSKRQVRSAWQCPPPEHCEYPLTPPVCLGREGGAVAETVRAGGGAPTPKWVVREKLQGVHTLVVDDADVLSALGLWPGQRAVPPPPRPPV